MNSISRDPQFFEQALEATTDSILVVDLHGKIAAFNKNFVALWHIPDSIIALRDDSKALAFVLDQLVEPEGFLKKVHELYAAPEQESFDTLMFKDGRIIERYSKPQRLKTGEIIGRVWSFRDVSEQERTLAALHDKIEELKLINKSLVGRELKMIELKKEIENLKKRITNNNGNHT